MFPPSHSLNCHTAAKSMQLLAVQKIDNCFLLSACLVLAFISSLKVCGRFSLGHSYCSSNVKGLMDTVLSSFIFFCYKFIVTSSVA